MDNMKKVSFNKGLMGKQTNDKCGTFLKAAF